MKIYEDKYFFYLRKPHGIPTSFGKKESFLDKIEQNKKLNILVKKNSKNHEFGLLNRLDNETAGFLYFAKNEKIYQEYKELQKNGKIEKIYLADIHGEIKQNTKIDFPIMHHKNLKEKMITIKDPASERKGRGKKHNVKTFIKPLYFDGEKNLTTAEIRIKQGIRHQIRCHLSSIGKPIKGDELYSKFLYGNYLHLRSIGLKIGTIFI